MRNIVEHIHSTRNLSLEELATLMTSDDAEGVKYLFQKAHETAQRVYGNKIFMRGLIEISNHCKNDCLYCGIRRSQQGVKRYRLTKEEILECCEQGYALGFRTFVMQGGEDGWFDDERMCDIVSTIHERYPDCAITLSLGERSRESYQRLYDAGASRYLLRHETADAKHYAKLHPTEMSYSNRQRCLHDLKEIGYQVGCGFMVSSPYQTSKELSKELKFIEEFKPDMCGIGPFVAHKDTPFKDEPSGGCDLTCYLLSIIRLIPPKVLLPATTALGTIDPLGREKGLKAGANVVMPNLSPVSVRKKYELYDNKICTGEEASECIECLRKRVEKAGYKIVTARGDVKK